ncbi:MAG: hypothetical protein ACYTKD_11960 [Planctomycetota bacterium]|jgi:hypothetical protein
MTMRNGVDDSRSAAGSGDGPKSLSARLAQWFGGLVILLFGFWVFYSIAGSLRLLYPEAPPVPWQSRWAVGAFGALLFVSPYLVAMLAVRMLLRRRRRDNNTNSTPHTSP